MLHTPLSPITAPTAALQLAVIGGGWAGLAAAVSLTQQGHRVHLWETSRHWGGRARALALRSPEGRTWQVDNGQHILIGAYAACLQLMRTVGVDPDRALLRRALDLRDIHGMGLQLPDLPPPWDAALGIARARGWSLRDKAALLLRAHRWQRQQFRCGQHATVADLCAGLPPRLLRDFVEPLCVSALNLPATQASGSVFLRVLQDSLFAGRGGSNLLIPQVDLGTLLPDAAAQWLHAHGAQLHLGQRVQHVLPCGAGGWSVDGQSVDGVVLATSSSEAARLVLHAASHGTPAIAPTQHTAACEAWAATADTLPYTAIATVYAHTPLPAGQRHALPAPMVALPSSAEAPAQFAFDRGQLGGPAGLIALVVSASTGSRAQVQAQVLAQARAQLQLPALTALQTVIDKRATFACTPAVQRPPAAIVPGLWACGDYVQGPYPATLEGAVRSGMDMAQVFPAAHKHCAG